MKYAKSIFITAFALLFTAAVIGSLWCEHTPEGQQWEQKRMERKAVASKQLAVDSVAVVENDRP